MQFKNIIEGLQILAKYEPKGLDTYLNGADHDIIWATTAEVDYDNIDVDEYGDDILVDSRISAEDAERLDELGWFISAESAEAWSAFV